MTGRRDFTIALVVLFATLLGARAAVAQRGASDDGLEQIDGRFRLTYLRPGATFDRYRRIAILDCYVEFRDQWLTEQNRGRSRAFQVTLEDVEQLKATLSTEFQEVFAETLAEDGAFEVIRPAAATDVLLLRPAVLEVDVAPDIYGAQQAFSQKQGISMTVYLEVYDSLSATLLARLIDPQTESSGDRAAPRRLLRQWARSARDALTEDFRGD